MGYTKDMNMLMQSICDLSPSKLVSSKNYVISFENNDASLAESSRCYSAAGICIK